MDIIDTVHHFTKIFVPLGLKNYVEGKGRGLRPLSTVGCEWNLTAVKASISQGILKASKHAIYHWNAL